MTLDDDDDFGFSAVSEDELKEMERHLQTAVVAQEQTAAQLQAKLEALYKAIMPLLNNLEKNPEKEYIFWPGRNTKIAAFKAKIEGIIKN